MKTGIVSAKNNERLYNVFQNNDWSQERLRNLSVHWLFVSANYSLRIAQRGPLVGQGRTDGSLVLLKRALVRRCLSLSPSE